MTTERQEQREAADSRFDQRLPMALESLSLATHRYLLRRDDFLAIPDSLEKRRPGVREKKIDELRAAQHNLTVQLEHVLSIFRTGKL